MVDSAEPGVPVALSPAAARKRIDGLALRAANRPLNAAVGQAYEGVAESDRPRHEVYVLTDLARSSWNPSQPVEGLERIKKVKSGVSTFVLRLTPKEARDVAVVAAEPSTSVAIRGEPVEVRAKLRSLGPATKRVAEFYLDGVKKRSEGRRPARQRRGRGPLPDPQARPRRRAAPGRGAHRRRPGPPGLRRQPLLLVHRRAGQARPDRLRPADRLGLRGLCARPRSGHALPRHAEDLPGRAGHARRVREDDRRRAQGLHRRLPAQRPGARRLRPGNRSTPTSAREGGW